MLLQSRLLNVSFSWIRDKKRKNLIKDVSVPWNTLLFVQQLQPRYGMALSLWSSLLKRILRLSTRIMKCYVKSKKNNKKLPLEKLSITIRYQKNKIKRITIIMFDDTNCWDHHYKKNPKDTNFMSFQTQIGNLLDKDKTSKFRIFLTNNLRS